MSDENLTQQTEAQTQVQSSPLRCVIGAMISGALGYGLYSLMIATATSFATKPIHSDNVIVLKLSSAVRTLVVGVMALGTAVFAIVAIGLLALGVQLLVQQLTKQKS
ncbi:MAG: DUF3082 domain-containing protein [Brasilonema octagenarum HA4186-MV1]|jgi:uncharacterized membrane protein YdbT with pleckstrin-like domain|uniref:DUF3082 domain-containing protein n=1 Tax=Brasilonema octagenarum UFV-OR1 TaxID=417115 RepID=A0ABX1M8A3_9CYAN|nr:DUF3082 domain-containing protein [Brasilonema octagenarum]MBW4629113.1 DUF3082 domain-containing protein [Brasilonema octagenarum HA4186-MV1]NMF63951.1 DUF3082 domain-containing protein [Brasilonema octagenarum UFV-OR1]